ncbi:MAG: tautomerase family protein, partial [Polycyclovorans sp.]|nr:tautomerase family protein [Polycyclovorans sp.]
MPINQISLLQGRNAAVVSECAREDARAVHKSLGAPLETIRVLVNELPASHWVVGDHTRSQVESEKYAVAAQEVTR